MGFTDKHSVVRGYRESKIRPEELLTQCRTMVNEGARGYSRENGGGDAAENFPSDVRDVAIVELFRMATDKPSEDT